LLNLNISESPLFKKQIKTLKKRFRNIQKDLDLWSESLQSTDQLGIRLKENVYKVRIANSDKNKGKSSGYRLFTYLEIINEELIFIYIYDKSDIENIDENELDKAILEALSI